MTLVASFVAMAMAEISLKLNAKLAELATEFVATEITMKIQFSDYDGPTGLFVANGEKILPLDSAAGATAFVGAGMQSGTIDPEQLAQIQAAVDSAQRRL